MDFQAWKDDVESCVDAFLGVSCDDLPDIDYWSLWDAGVIPSEAAGLAMSQLLDNAESFEPLYDTTHPEGL